MVERARSGSWVVNRRLPGEEDTENNQKQKSRDSEVANLYNFSSIWYNKKISRNKNDNMGLPRKQRRPREEFRQQTLGKGLEENNSSINLLAL